MHAARNLPRTLEAARDAGWQVVGAALEESVEPSQLEQSAPTVLVLGSEGHGLRTNVLRVLGARAHPARRGGHGGGRRRRRIGRLAQCERGRRDFAVVAVGGEESGGAGK